MLRTTFFFLLFVGGLVVSGPADASWAHTHLQKAWAGDLSYQEVKDLAESVDTVALTTQDGYWTIVLLAAHYGAAGDLTKACATVARLDDVGKWRKDMRLDALRSACMLEAGAFEDAARHASRAAIAAAGSEPIDYLGILFLAHEVRATALIRLAAAAPDDAGRKRHAKRALVAWEAAARERNVPAALVEALAWQAHLAER